MKLLLTSQSLTNDSLKQALREMLGKPSNQATITYIPTAGNIDPGDRGWLVDNLADAKSLGWKKFNILDLAVVASWPKDLWWPRLEEADVIMVGGGNSGYLSYWMERSGLMDELTDMLENKIYVGTSAGSMFLTPSQAASSGAIKNAPSFDFPLDDNNVPPGQVSQQTMGAVGFLIRPHWQAANAPQATQENAQRVANHTQFPVYLIDDQTGIKVTGEGVEVISEGDWLLIEPSIDSKGTPQPKIPPEE